MFAEKTNYGCVWTRSIVPKAFPAAYSIETPSVQNVFFIDMAIVIKTFFEYNVENCRDGNKAHYCGQHPFRSHVYPVYGSFSNEYGLFSIIYIPVFFLKCIESIGKKSIDKN